MNTETRPTMAVASELWTLSSKHQAETFEVISKVIIESGPEMLNKEMVSALLQAILQLNEITEVQGSAYGTNLYSGESVQAFTDELKEIHDSLESMLSDSRQSLYSMMMVFGYPESSISAVKDLIPEYEEAGRLCGYATQIIDLL